MPKTQTLQSDFKGLSDWVEIFRAGSQTDSRGNTRQFSQADLDQVVSNHDPKHPAPHVITHKEMYSPFAYGQASELKREGDSLFVKSKKIDPNFEQLVQKGRLYERSVRLLPTKKGWSLGHIAWLGAEPPAVEGMAPVAFSANDQGFDYTMDTQTPSALVRMMRNMREFLIENFSKDEADAVMPDWEIDSLNRHLGRLETEEDQTNPTSFSQNTHTGDNPVADFTQADIDAAKKQGEADAKKQAEADFSQQKTKLQAQLDSERSERLRTDCEAVVKAHVERGVIPATLAGVTDFMLRQQTDNNVFEFSQGEGKSALTVKISPLDFFKNLLDKLPGTLSTSESDAGDDLDASVVDFDAPQGVHVDADALVIHNKAVAYQQKHPDVAYLDAALIVTQQENS